MKNIYELQKLTEEIKKKSDIEKGCTLNCENPEVLKIFDTLEEAKIELNKYQSEARYTRGFHMNFWTVTEYVIACYREDEDGEFVDRTDYEMNDLSIEDDAE